MGALRALGLSATVMFPDSNMVRDTGFWDQANSLSESQYWLL